MMFRPELIGLSGYARSGKDTVARIMQDHFGYESAAIADALRNILYATDTDVRRAVDAHGWEATKVAGTETREKLQRLGAALRDEFGNDHMIHHALKPFNDGEIEHLVISDVRTVAEAAAITQLGGYIIRIDRPGVGPANHDVTERMLPSVDHIIVNDGSVVDMIPAVEQALSVLWEQTTGVDAEGYDIEVTWHG